MITAKFGGTSLCDASHFQTVREILSRREDRRFVVVSAPGKRFGDDVKITDQLYRCHQEARQGGQVEAAFAPVATRFREIVAGLGLSLDLEEEFRATLWAMERGAGQAFCASRGEYFSARIMAALLDLPFLDPAQCTFFDQSGQFDGEAARAARRGDAGLLRWNAGRGRSHLLPGWFGHLRGHPGPGLRLGGL